MEGLLTSSDAWVFDGTLCHVPPDSTDPNAMPVYRFGARDGAVRFYTIDPAERDRFFRDFRDAWAYEGIAFYAYRPSRRLPRPSRCIVFGSDSGGGISTPVTSETARTSESRLRLDLRRYLVVRL